MYELFWNTVEYLKNVDWYLVLYSTFIFYLGRGFQKLKEWYYKKYVGGNRNKLEF